MNPRACAAVVAAVVAVIGTSRPVGAQIQPFQGPDLYRLQTVGDVQISPDGQRVAYSVRKSDRPGRPYSEVWVMETASGEVSKLGGEGGVASGPRVAERCHRLENESHGRPMATGLPSCRRPRHRWT